MREKLETLSLAQLKELAKGAGVRGISALRKAELIDILVKQAEKEEKEKAEREKAEKEKAEKEKAEKEKAEKEKAEKEKAKKEASEKAAVKKAQEKKPAAKKQPVPGHAPRKKTEKAAEPVPAEGPEKNGHRENTHKENMRDQNARQENLRAENMREENTREENAGEEKEPREAKQQNELPEKLASVADNGPQASGILEVMQDGFGFIRCENYLPGDNDVYVSPSQIRRFNLKTGDIITGSRRVKTASEKFAALLYVNTVNGVRPSEIMKRQNFEDMTPIFPDERIHLDVEGTTTAMRVVDLISPIGKGQRGMIVSPPKAGKTTLLKQIAKVVTSTQPDMHVIILLIDERPEEVTDIREYIEGPQVEVIYSTFDELPERHKRVSEMVIERAKRLVEQHRDVMILLDSITRLSRAYNLTIVPSGRTLSGGLDPAALYMPKRFFGAARNMREGGSLTVLATALVDTGSRMDDMVYEEFKGTGNMELVLDRKLSEKRIFPAVDILKSGTRRDDLLLSREERGVLDMIHKATSSQRPEESVERILDLFAKTRSNAEIIQYAKYNRL